MRKSDKAYTLSRFFPITFFVVTTFLFVYVNLSFKSSRETLGAINTFLFFVAIFLFWASASLSSDIILKKNKLIVMPVFKFLKSKEISYADIKAVKFGTGIGEGWGEFITLKTTESAITVANPSEKLEFFDDLVSRLGRNVQVVEFNKRIKN